MSNSPAISIENLSKFYELHNAAPADTLRDLIGITFRKLWQRPPSSLGSKTKFPALRSLTLHINRGEIVGIIGKNGAGKSTLLRLLSRVTQPSEGNIYFVGKVAALLEVGLGFHPDLTGRENVYLGGTLLGLDRNTIKSRLPEISAFAEIGDFLDLPVKKYSSGMYVRLAFAIAAHLDADILLIDEVLAVGDAAFQKKCLQKIQEINRQGTTILFVSHNLAAVERLCQRCLVLNAGQIEYDGNPDAAITFYREKILGIELRAIYQRSITASVSQIAAYLQSAAIYDWQHNPNPKLPAGSGCQIHIQIVRRDQQVQPYCTIYLRSVDGQIVARLAPQDAGFILEYQDSQLNLLCTIPHLPLVPHRYSIDVHLYTQAKTIEYIESALSIEIVEPVVTLLPNIPDKTYRGLVLLEQHWSITH